MDTPPAGPALLGEGSMSPGSRVRLHAGSIVWIAPGLKLGVVRINSDGTVDAKVFGGSRDTFFEQYVILRRGQPTEARGHRVHLVDVVPDGEPRPWARVLCR